MLRPARKIIDLAKAGERHPHNCAASPAGILRAARIKRSSRAGFEKYQIAGQPPVLKCAMVALIYRCPITRLNVQAWIADDPSADDDIYEALTCAACSRMHLVNRSTGRTLRDDADE
jgi:hypothetical protein